MATYYTSSNNQRDGAPMIYIPGSYPDAPIIPGNIMMYMNSGSFSDALAGNTLQQNNCIEIPSVGAPDSTQQQEEVFSNLGGPRIVEHDFNAWREARNEVLVMHSIGGPSSILHVGQNLHGQGLSLSLGTQIPSAIHMPSIPYRNLSSGFASFLSPNPSTMGEGGGRNGSRDEELRAAEYLPPGFVASNQDANKVDMSPHGMTSIARTIPNSKYLKAAQQLLDEVVNVRKALKHPDTEKNQSTHELGMKNSKESENGSKNEPSNPQDSSNNSPSELSHTERQELQNKLTKLLSMLDEVDRRYKQYYHQMQIVVSSFDVISGSGAAKPYTALALQTISRHFRCLRDAITGQIGANRKSLGEQDSLDNGKGIGIPRLRYVDQQLRQQRALQQLGMMQQHAWRPQRGLPESSVSILRAWLFEHFLHPYPKDSDKIMLARQTGLTRSQVSNWFINARVRLWKPMVEEMYKEETGDGDMDSVSSSENVAKAARGNMRASEDRGEEMQQSVSSTAPERCSIVQLMESRSDNIHDLEMAGSNARSNFHSGTRGDAMPEYGLLNLSEKQKPCMDECNLFTDALVHSDGGDQFMAAAAAAAYQISEVGRFGGGNGVSLTLGLQHCESGSLPLSGSTQHSFISMRGDDIFGASASSVGAEPSELECINPVNRQQHRFSSSHLLHDFVA